jgi:hypothetical protein
MGWVSNERFLEIESLGEEIRKMLNSLIKYIKEQS